MSYKHRSCTGRSFSMCREDDGCHYTKGPDRRYCRKIGKKAPVARKHNSKKNRKHSTYSLLRYLHSRKRHVKSKKLSRSRKRHTKRELSSLFLF
jgi:hypothetical protein